MGKRKVADDGTITVEGKRGNGEGNIRQRGDGRWEARVVLADGRRKSVFGPTRAAAAAKLVTVQKARADNLPVPSERTTVGAYLSDWLAHVAAPRVRASTLAHYQSDVRLHITPALGSRRLAQLTPADVRQFLAGLSAAGLGARSVAHNRAVLRTALQHAVREGLAARNVATLVDVPRYEPKPVGALTPADARAILDGFTGHDYEALVTLALATGLRCGELLGLRWSDLDLDAGALRCERQLQRRAGVYQLVPLKTQRSRRTLALPPVAIDALRREKVRQMERQLAAGPAWHEELPGLVFTGATGNPLHGSTVTHRFQDRLKAQGLPPRRFHDLRHGAASLLLAHGASMRVVMEQLGHSQIALTMNTYAHIAPELLRENAALLNRALGG